MELSPMVFSSPANVPRNVHSDDVVSTDWSWVLDLVVPVSFGSSVGSGVIVSDRHVLTCGHVVKTMTTGKDMGKSKTWVEPGGWGGKGKGKGKGGKRELVQLLEGV